MQNFSRDVAIGSSPGGNSDATDIDGKNLPTADPHVEGKLWIDPTGHIVVSAG